MSITDALREQEDKEWRAYHDQLISEMADLRATLSEKIKDLEQQINGIDHCIKIMTRDEKENAAAQVQRR